MLDDKLTCPFNSDECTKKCALFSKLTGRCTFQDISLTLTQIIEAIENVTANE